MKKEIKLTASTVAKRAGFKTLKEVAELTNLTTATLHNYFNEDKPRFFDALHTAARHKVNIIESHIN